MVVFLLILNQFMSKSTSTPILGVNADTQAQTINTTSVESAQGNNTTTQPTTYNDLQYITPEEYKVIEAIFDRIGNNTLEWCAEYLHDLTNYKHTDFLATQPSVIAHLLSTATEDNRNDLNAFVKSLANVNRLLADLLDTYGILRDAAHFATLVERASRINYEDVTAVASTM